jgi:hypothetical protein
VLLFLACGLLCGCAEHKRVVAHGEMVVARECMVEVELTPKSECRYKQGEELMRCTGFKLTKLVGCEVLEVKVKKGEVKK